jgi:hypothetical protein
MLRWCNGDRRLGDLSAAGPASSHSLAERIPVRGRCQYGPADQCEGSRPAESDSDGPSAVIMREAQLLVGYPDSAVSTLCTNDRGVAHPPGPDARRSHHLTTDVIRASMAQNNNSARAHHPPPAKTGSRPTTPMRRSGSKADVWKRAGDLVGVLCGDPQQDVGPVVIVVTPPLGSRKSSVGRSPGPIMAVGQLAVRAATHQSARCPPRSAGRSNEAAAPMTFAPPAGLWRGGHGDLSPTDE